MKGTSVVKQYFSSGSRHYVTPSVSAEWNYNLFYAPYATFSGNGNAITTNWTNTSNWNKSGCTATYDTAQGRTSTSYTDTSCLKLTAYGQNGSASIVINPTGSATNNTYKVIFYAKLVENAQVTLTALNYVDSQRSSSASQVIDSAVWTKFEVYVSSLPTENPYTTFTLTLDFTSLDTTIGSQTQQPISSYNVLIDQFEVFQTTEQDYQYGNLWQTSAPFGFFRPGESYIPSGNLSTPLPTNFRKINSSFQQTSFNGQVMPVSPVTYHPTVLGSAKSNPLFKNGILSDYTTYKYFVSDGVTNSLGALYDKVLATNKIVIKLNVNYSEPTSLTVNLYNTVNNYNYTKSLTSSDISDAGVIILYHQADGSWTTTPWTIMPMFNTTGQITNYQNINKIVVTQNSANINPAYQSPSNDITNNTMDGISYPNRYSNYQKDMKRLHVVEISPRIEIDLTNYLVSVNTKEELDNKEYPLPISGISANSAKITLSNIPFKLTDNILSLFSNNSSSSPLNGLFKNNVKFYINYIIQDSLTGASGSDKVISGGVYYAEEWIGKDLQQTEIIAYDISKYLQLLSPTDYVSQSQDVFNVISNIMDFAGFTDYDYDSLKKVTSSRVPLTDGSTTINLSPIKSSYFYCDGLQQKVFDVLRELFEVYQIGAYINSYGVMKFLDLENILSNVKPNILLHDSKTPIVISTPTYTDNLTITSNITENTYTEKIGTKLGKATMKFKIPQINKTFGIEGISNTQSLETKVIDKNDILWQLEKESVVTFNFLNQSINSYSQNYFYLDPNDLTKTFRSFNIDQEGYAIIEGEIVSFKDKEFLFTVTDPVDNAATSSNIISDYRVVVSNAADLQAAISDYSARSGYGGSVSYTPTGKICNIERGLFNTPVRVHKIIDSVSTLLTRTSVISGLQPSVSNNQIIMNASQQATKSILSPTDNTSSSTTPYQTFSTKMRIGPSSDSKFQAGVGGGLVFNIEGTPTYVEIRQVESGGKYVGSMFVPDKSYMLYVYQGNSPTSTTTLLGSTTNPIVGVSINKNILDESDIYPVGSPFEEFGKIINLKFVKIKNPSSWVDPKTKQTVYGPSFEIYINKKKLSLKTKKIDLDTSGRYGIFTQTVNAQAGTTGSIGFTEIYATQTPLDRSDLYYHWQLNSFANTLAGKHKVFEVNYMLQVRPEVIGINYYDIQYQTAPALNAYSVPSPYDWFYFTEDKTKANNATNGNNQNLKLNVVSVGEDALTYSNIYNSGFRGRFAIINGSPSMIWLKKTPDSKNPVDVTYLVNTNDLVSLSTEISIEKIFDPANISESIEINSNWVQSKSAAIGILKNIFKAVDGFSRDTRVSVYGNPLFEVGDVLQVSYSQKGIINKKYFVQGVEQLHTYGLETVLTLNELTSS
jgi:hypothetical protein